MRARRPRRNSSQLDFDKTQYVDEIMIDRVSVLMLKSLLKAGGFNEFLSKDNYFNDDEVAYFLDLNKYLEQDSDEFNRSDVLKELQQKSLTLENQQNFPILTSLEKNIAKLDNLLNFTKAEKEILTFVICLKNYKIMDTILCYLGRDLTTIRVKKILSIILNLDYEDVENALSQDSILMSSSLISMNRITGDLDQKFELLNDKFADFMMNGDGDILNILKDFIIKMEDSPLDIDDFDYMKKDVSLLQKHLKKAIAKKQKGVNILLYGVPGTGKTELTKMVANLLDIELFEISYLEDNDNSSSANDRIKAYRSAQAILKNEKYLLMYDEAEDIFDSYDGLFSSKKQENKALINRMLESNQLPTIWITNNIYTVDNAIVRRFDIAMELEIPKRKKRVSILKKYSNDKLDKKTINKLSHNEFISPAVMQRAIKVAQNIADDNISKTVLNLIDKTLKAQGYPSIKINKDKKIKEKPLLPNVYDTSFINADENLELLAKNIADVKNARICLYGTPGTGKSAYGLYIAKKIGCKAIVKKGSDLLSKWVGGTEQNIAQAFKEAKDKKAVLIFDEVDSFLKDRASAKNSWEISQVNELLTQMESFDGVFVATTNLMDNLDQASLRRFDLKMEFKYLKPNQTQKLFSSYLKELSLQVDKKMLEKVKTLDLLAPGDFNTVVRQNKFRPIKDGLDMIHRLEEEIALKDVAINYSVGFKV